MFRIYEKRLVCPRFSSGLEVIADDFATDGRVDSLPSSPPSIISTGGARSLAEEAPRRKAPNPDVKEVLREIFKDKKKGGTIKRANLRPVSAIVA